MMKTNIIGSIIDGFSILFNPANIYEGPSINEKEKNDGNEAELIVKGRIFPQKETVMISEVNGFTKTKVEVTEIVAGKEDIPSILVVQEPYIWSYYGGKQCLIVENGYEPSITNKEYLFFLNKERNSDEFVRGTYKIKKMIAINNR